MESQQRIQYGGFWARAGAAIIDSVVVTIVIAPLLIAIRGPGHFVPEHFALGHFVSGAALASAESMNFDSVSLLISWVLPAAAVVLFWMFRQATPGKMALSLRIVDAWTGNEPSTGQCIGRYFGYFVALIPFGLGILWVAVDPRKQGWHDKLAGTVVVRSRSTEEPAGIDPAQAH